MAVPANGATPTLSPGPAPCAGGDCSSATSVSCNTVVNWRNNDIEQWNTYNCLDTNIFSSLPYSETFYSLSIVSDSLDFSLAIPKATVGMDNFGAVLDSCDSDACQAATHVMSRTIYQHAIYPDAPIGAYTLAIDSPNMSGQGDAIIACGSHDTGWCGGVVSTTLSCGVYSIYDDTTNGIDNIIYYYPHGIYAYDGPELVYELVLTATEYLSLTLHYAGNPAMDYTNYMSLFFLDNTCNQRSPVLLSGLAGETGATATSIAALMPAGTYYLVVDGMHMPSGGDAFSLDVVCKTYHIYLPLALRNYQ